MTHDNDGLSWGTLDNESQRLLLDLLARRVAWRSDARVITSASATPDTHAAFARAYARIRAWLGPNKAEQTAN